MQQNCLTNKSIVLTRTPEQSTAMTRALESLGARVISFPTIKLIEPPDESPIKQAIAQLDSYDWILFTSINAVNRFFTYLPKGACCQHFPKIAVVGPSTAHALELRGYRVELMPETNFQAEGLVEAFETLSKGKISSKDSDESRGHVLIPRALEARDVLQGRLPKLGYEVTVAPIYETVQANPSSADILSIETADGIAFTSPSTVRNFIAIVDGSTGICASTGTGAGISYLNGLKIFSIGAVTTAELYSNPIDRNHIFEAEESTGESLVNLIAMKL
ncbi:MAG: uroporphyrinogen-III synthase [Coriobacteriia bacterium]|nr:uroporphyrinogen-III synthase [Coriobacteriia bacterium]